jgi:HlyD family secretion protein
MADANVQNAQAVVEQRQATLEQGKLDLERTLIRAPIDGVIYQA